VLPIQGMMARTLVQEAEHARYIIRIPSIMASTVGHA
jgi:hypothetical protein